MVFHVVQFCASVELMSLLQTEKLWKDLDDDASRASGQSVELCCWIGALGLRVKPPSQPAISDERQPVHRFSATGDTVLQMR